MLKILKIDNIPLWNLKKSKWRKLNNSQLNISVAVIIILACQIFQ